MFTAGIESGSIITDWLIIERQRHPRVMKKAQDETKRVVGEKAKRDTNDINQMDYLKKGYSRENKSRPQCLGNPKAPRLVEKTGPERFENNPIDFNSQDFHLIPVGFGRRRCPGLAFGIAGVEYYLIANLLYWFDWKLPDDVENMDMTKVHAV